MISGCFGRRIHLVNLHGKHLLAAGFGHRPVGHHNPHHGFHDSGVWIVEKHGTYTDRVSLRSAVNGAYLVHHGHYVSLHKDVGWSEASWHMNEWDGVASFRSHRGEYLSLDEHDHNVHVVSHYDGRPHGKQLFHVRHYN